MVKLTVIYTLPDGADHEEFLKWRTTEHQEDNMDIPGVIKSDFYAVRNIYSHKTGCTSAAGGAGSGDGLTEEPPSYRYITEAYWPDMESFQAAFFDTGYQEKLMESLTKIANPMFIISEEVLSEEK